jgi:predicted permease
MNNYALMVCCFVVGLLLRHFKRLPENAASTLNGFVVNVALPALTLAYVHGLTIDTALIVPALMAWVLFGFGCAFFWLLAKVAGFNRATTGGLMLTGGLANTSFLGLPMIETFYGRSYLGLGILMDQVGSYLVLSTLGVLVASIYSSDSKVNARVIGRKIVTFAPFQAFIVAIILSPVSYPEWLNDLFLRLGGTVVPLTLISVGMQLRLSQLAGKKIALSAGLGFKLLLGPLLVLLLFAGVIGTTGMAMQVTAFESAMAPMIGASIVAMDHDLDTSLVTLMVGIGIPMSFLTLPIWAFMLHGI